MRPHLSLLVVALAMPVASAEFVELGAKDVVVLEMAYHISREEWNETARELKKAFPHNTVVMLEPGVELKTVRCR